MADKKEFQTQLTNSEIQNGIEIPIQGLSTPADWSTIFGKPGLLNVEIGIGQDTFLIDLARHNSGKLLLGIEYSPVRITRVKKKIKSAGVSGIRLLNCEALKAIACLIDPETVENFYIFFPDPWPKKKHDKNRLINPASARLLATRLTINGKLYLKTDDEQYKNIMIDVLEKTFFLKNLYGPGQLSRDKILSPHETIYEQKWRKQGKDIYSLVYTRTSNP